MTNQNSEPSGVLILNKPKGPTSHDMVYRVRRLYSTKKVGHTGTLDPMAEGVLVMLIGRAAKAAEYLVSDTKKYIATLRLGYETDTQDITGNVTNRFGGQLPSEEEVKKAVSAFLGKSLQVPPMYSALKVGGKKLVDLARAGEVVERQPRPIEIFDIECNKINETDYSLAVHCSSGTYIRTLCEDIGKELGCFGTMATLCRSETGGFSLDESYTEEQLCEMTTEQRLCCLIPTESLFKSLGRVNLPPFYEKLCRSGCEIYLAKIKADFDVGERVRLCDKDGAFFALGEVSEYDKGKAVKSIKIFNL